MGEELAQTFAHNRVVIHDHHADNVAHAQPLILSVGTCTRMLVSMPWLRARCVDRPGQRGHPVGQLLEAGSVTEDSGSDQASPG